MPWFEFNSTYCCLCRLKGEDCSGHKSLKKNSFISFFTSYNIVLISNIWPDLKQPLIFSNNHWLNCSIKKLVAGNEYKSHNIYLSQI